MSQEQSIDSSRRVIAKVMREHRTDPLDEETTQMHSEPSKFRFRVHRHCGWSDDQTQKEI